MIDITLAREHLKADDETVETTLIEQYIASAQQICEGYCNRKFYENATALSADYTLARVDFAAIKLSYETEMAAETDCDIKQMIGNKYIIAIGNIKQRVNGIVIDNTIIAAMLFTLGHLYRNRQEVVVGQNAGATQIPAGARRILEPYLWIGDLG